MKKTLRGLMLLACLLCMSAASMAASDEGQPADLYETVGVENVPDEIKEFMNASQWADWEITGWVNPSGIRSEDACAFLAAKKGSANDLLAFGSSQGAWRYLWHNSAALPQVEAPVELAFTLTPAVNFSSYYVYNEEIEEAFCSWVQDDHGTWNLSQMHNFHPSMIVDAPVKNALHFWVDGEDTQMWFYGGCPTDLQTFDFDRFPKTFEDARALFGDWALGNLNVLASRQIAFPSGKKYNVYQGPGEEYGQAGNGKAVVSTNDWIEVFGSYNGWILIEYAISGEHLRIGWIAESALPQGAVIEELAFASVPARTVVRADLTDDPLASKMPVVSLPQGTDVLWLANFEDCAYVQCNTQPPIYGFIDMRALSVSVE